MAKYYDSVMEETLEKYLKNGKQKKLSEKERWQRLKEKKRKEGEHYADQ
ncbi:MAG: hypothetical protein IJ733_06145 [Lachnospiraceae bacterium]|nr:hypothetical protein [Lachnospiraceae bacterium]